MVAAQHEDRIFVIPGLHQWLALETKEFVLVWEGNRFTVPKEFVERFKAIGVEHGVEIRGEQIRACIPVVNDMRFRFGVLPMQLKLMAM